LTARDSLSFTIDPLRREDWARVRAIYAEGLATGLTAFTTTPPRWDQWDRGHLALGRLVARDKSGVLSGWAALAPVPDT
jgi:phosphinothricin acetyltransferase